MKGRTILGIGLGLGAVGLAGTGWYAWDTVRHRSPPFDSSDPLPGELDGETGENWGKTPVDLVASFALMEEASRVPGLGRLASLIAFMETEWIGTFHDQNREESNRLYTTKKASRPPLKFGKQAAEFGRGGLFAIPGPAFLWTGVEELKQHAPFLPYKPRLMVANRRTSLFSATVYLVQLLKRAVIADTREVVIGWLDEQHLFAELHGKDGYNRLRGRVEFAAQEIEIDLDAIEMPNVSAWPGAQRVFERIVLMSKGGA